MKDLTQYIKESQTIKKFTDIIIECNGELLLLRRANYIKCFGGKWCIPGGYCDNNEISEKTALRELKEETSINISNPSFLMTYKYVTGETTDVYYKQLSDKPEVKISREHAQFKWIQRDELNKYEGKYAGETYNILNKYIETIK